MTDADRVTLPSEQVSSADPVTELVIRTLKVPVMLSGARTVVAQDVIVIVPTPRIALPDKSTSPFEEMGPPTGPE
jgi:hypothetical protein